MKRLFAFLVLTAFSIATLHAQDWAKARLDKSPRHIEWIKVKQGARDVECSIAFPQVEQKATAVIVIHEIFGLTDWVRSVTDQLAEAGYIAIAPDFLSGIAGARGGDGARGAIGGLPPDQITADLDAVVDYVSKLPSCNGKVIVAGFCWGGRQTLRYATHNKNIKAGFVFYGEAVPGLEFEKISCPIYGFYGSADNRVTSTVAGTEAAMKKAGKTYEQVTYAGAGHGFMKTGEDPAGTEPNKKAREEGWKRWKDLLKKVSE